MVALLGSDKRGGHLPRGGDARLSSHGETCLDFRTVIGIIII